MEVIDLHTHTNHSDGTLDPVALINLARKHDVRALSITDHDTVAAYADPNTYRAAADANIELVPGIEISSADENGNKVHILGLFIDPCADGIKKVVDRQQASRLQYAIGVSRCLQQSGWFIDLEGLLGGSIVTKAHLADAVLSLPDNISKLSDAFGDIPTRGQFIERLMNKGGDCYVEKNTVPPAEAVKAIHDSGGLAMLAHPVAYVYEGGSIGSIKQQLASVRYDGLESFYYYYDKSGGDVKVDEINRFTELAKELDLLVCGGSDYHGVSPTLGNYVEIGFDGEVRRPQIEILDALKSAL